MQAQQVGAAPADAPAGSDAASLQQQLRAVQRELRAVAAAVDGYHQQQEEQQAEGQQQQQQQQQQAGEDAAGGGQAPPPPPAPAATAAGALQAAVMQQRLEGLQARKQQLEQSLRELGVEPVAAAPAAGPGPSSQQQQRRQGKQQPPAKAAAAAGGSRGKKGRGRGAPADLAEADIFEGEEGGGGGGAEEAAGGLVETERDRLIRLVRCPVCCGLRWVGLGDAGRGTCKRAVGPKVKARGGCSKCCCSRCQPA